MKNAVYAGSFDPFTLGHLHIYKQATDIFDNVTILIAKNPKKTRFTDIEQMQDILMAVTQEDNIEIWDGLVADYCKEHRISYLVRGLRNTSDYMYEEEIAKVNLEIFPDLQTIYFRAKDDVISSSLVRLFMEQGKDISKYVPSEIFRNLSEIITKKGC